MLIILLGWVLFYYDSLAACISHVGAMFGLVKGGIIDPESVYVLKDSAILIVVAVLCCFPWGRYIKEKALARGKWPKQLDKAGKLLQPALMSMLLLLSLFFLVGQSFNPFLYFRF